MTEQLEADLVGIEDPTSNLDPCRFVFAGLLVVGHRVENLEGLRMLDAGYAEQHETTLAARISQFGELPTTNSEIVIVEDGAYQICRVTGPIRRSQCRLVIEMDIRALRSDEAKNYWVDESGLYIITEDGDRIEVQL